MITLYSGTPGSGKSYHAASDMFHRLRHKKNYICNFNINLDNVSLTFLSYLKRKLFKVPADKLRYKKLGRFDYVNNLELTPDYLLKYAREHHSFKKEGETTVVIDECGIIFNSRSWNAKDRLKWIEFFSLHRHYGYDFILISQSERLIDRQIRSFIEYDIRHRKLNNYNLFGTILGLLSGGALFVGIKYWHGIRKQVGKEFFSYKRRVASIYDTFLLFGDSEPDKTAEGKVDSGRGAAPAPGGPRTVPALASDALPESVNSKELENGVNNLYISYKTCTPPPSNRWSENT